MPAMLFPEIVTKSIAGKARSYTRRAVPCLNSRMFICCLHCHELIAIDQATRLAPEICPRCGGALRDRLATGTSAADATDTGERSFVSFLQGSETATASTTQIPTAAGTEALDEATTASLVLPEGADAETADADAGTGSGMEADTDSEREMEAGIIDEPAPGLDPQAIDSTREDAIAGADAPTPVASAPAPQAFPATPSFTRKNARSGSHPRAAGWQWALLIALSLTLALQVLLADRARLAADAAWRPLISPLCAALGCSIPPWHQPDALTMLSRDVSPIAGRAGGLNVQATFRNDARWAQAWPVLQLSLSDADGRVLGSRAFTPREYLGATAAQTELAPGQSAHIALQLHEPNPNVVAFTFDFR